MTSMIAYGGGTNSAAILVGMRERVEEPPDLILFADTGGEKPHTYRHVEIVNEWLQGSNWPQITTVRAIRKAGHFESLEEQCLRLGVLPAIAYGWKTCSQRYKVEPQEKFVNNWSPAQHAWARGEKVVKSIGYDIDETARWRKKFPDDPKYTLRFPLVEWCWGRDECVEAITRAGLPLPGKSACFFCPSSRKSEIQDLQQTNPALFARALEIERKATAGEGEGKSTGLKSVKGLGRQFAWSDVDRWPRQNEIAAPCGCYDGEA